MESKAERRGQLSLQWDLPLLLQMPASTLSMKISVNNINNEVRKGVCALQSRWNLSLQFTNCHMYFSVSYNVVLHPQLLCWSWSWFIWVWPQTPLTNQEQTCSLLTATHRQSEIRLIEQSLRFLHCWRSIPIFLDCLQPKKIHCSCVFGPGKMLFLKKLCLSTCAVGHGWSLICLISTLIFS